MSGTEAPPHEGPKTPSLRPGDVVTVLGAGNMGSGIAQAAAQAGFQVRIRDLAESDLQRGLTMIQATLDGAIKRGKLTVGKKEAILGRLHFTTDLSQALERSRLVIEAVFEEEKVKRLLFESVVRQVEPSTMVVSNTSSLSIARLFQDLEGPDRFAGLHFFYPAAINRLVEVVSGPGTSSRTLDGLVDFSYQLRKIPVKVKDSAGFCVNRFFVPYLNEATRIWEEGLADLPTIEAAANHLLGTTLGPFQLMNVTGIPIAFHSATSLAQAFGDFYAPSAALKAQFESRAKWGALDGPVEEARVRPVQRRLEGVIYGIAARLVEEGVATPEESDRAAVVGLKWAVGPFTLMGKAGMDDALRAVEKIHERWGASFPIAKELRLRGERHEALWPLSHVQLRKEPPLAWVLLDRPEVLNALNSKVLAQLEGALQEAASDPEVRVVLLAGSSRVFAAGADIAEMASKTAFQGREFTFLGQRVAHTLETLSKPVIAVVEGYALGGGLELALAADFILAAEGTQMALPEVSLGIHPGFGGTQRLVRLIGRARTKLLVESGLPILAEEAEKWGLVARVHPAAVLKDEAQKMALAIASRAPLAVAMARRVIDRGADADLETALQLEGESASLTFATEDQKEGMRAYLERRPPQFKGR
jgi:enoyl-CoA hydratase/3-hydroxyacyl-CoA dehydrogenase